jgi:hypothetical protein
VTGRTDTNKRVVFSDLLGSDLTGLHGAGSGGGGGSAAAAACRGLEAGEYVEVEVVEATGHTLRGRALRRSTIAEWWA